MRLNGVSSLARSIPRREDDEGAARPRRPAGEMVKASVQSGVRAVETAVTQELESVVDAVTAEVGRTALEVVGSAVRNVAEGLLQFFRGAARLLRGDVSGGLRDLGVGLVKAFVQTPIDALLLGGGKLVSAVQTALGLEPAGRGLAPEEIATLRRVFGDSIDYERVRIKQGSAGLFGANARPFALGDTLYLKNERLTDGLLVHEMTHVWQFQNGGSDYISEALASQWWGHGYDWKKSVPETPFGALEPEQQAQFLEEAFAAGAFETPPRRFVSNGVDYGDYLARALDAVRAGRNAP